MYTVLHIDLETWLLEKQHPTPNLTDRHVSYNTNMSEPKNCKQRRAKIPYSIKVTSIKRVLEFCFFKID